MTESQKEPCISNTNSQSTSIPTALTGSSSENTFKSALQSKLQRKSTRKKLVRVGLVTGNLALFAVVGSFLYLQPSSNSGTHLASAAQRSDSQAASPLDQLSSANIALTVARMSDLPETTAITNQADSEDVTLSQASTMDSSVSSKPQVVASAFKSAKDIRSYTVLAGDTVASIATKFGVSSDSVRWSNNITGDAVTPGANLVIPPVNGIVYTVANGDNAETVAAKFSADKNKIIAFNDAEINGITAGQRIMVPDGQKAAQVARATATSTTPFAARGGTASYGYNGYDFGYCTYWVAVLRQKAGSPVPTNLGNAATWAVRAAAYGLETGSTPRVGAAVVMSTKGAGHVAYVTAVNADGSITISEMNHAGWNKVNERTVTGSYRYVY